MTGHHVHGRFFQSVISSDKLGTVDRDGLPHHQAVRRHEPPGACWTVTPAGTSNTWTYEGESISSEGMYSKVVGREGRQVADDDIP